MRLSRFALILLLFSFFTAVLYPYSGNAARYKKSGDEISNKYAALIVDARTGNILHQENSNSLRYPASLTKMMTLYLTFEALETGKLRMNEKLYVSAHAANQPRMNMRMRPGQVITVKEAILSLVVKSANDVAVVLAEAVAGSEMQFALLMTRKARKLGMTRTTFQNASGLHSPRQRSTARDMAKLVIALQRDYPQYYSLFSRTSFTYRGRVFVGHNRVTKNYPGADGVKTGFLRVSGYNLASSAIREGNRLVGVVLGGRTALSRDRRMMALFDASFNRMRTSNPTLASASTAKPQAEKKSFVRRKKYLKKNSIADQAANNPLTFSSL